MNVGSTFSGVGGLDLGLERAGMSHLWFCEVDEYRRRVLGHHWPGRPIFRDVQSLCVGESEGGTQAYDILTADHHWRGETWTGLPSSVDVLAGGFPCQDLSVSGKRAGLAGERSGLFYDYARIAATLRPRFLLVENVPGTFSSHGGRDFGIVLETLADLGYGLAWRVLDSRFFGVPQRRRRLYLVGVRADDDPRESAERAGQILAVGTRCEGHHPKSRKARSNASRTAEDSTLSGGSPRHYFVEDHVDGTLRACGKDGKPRSDKQPLLAYNIVPDSGQGATLRAAETKVSQTLSSVNGQAHDRITAIVGDLNVRRLTPLECERLQGWPDHWTDPFGDAKDTERMAAIGDGVTAPVAEWIGWRIRQFD